MTGRPGRRRPAAWAGAIVVGVAVVTAGACGGGASPQPDATPGTLPSHTHAVAGPGPSRPFATDAALTIGLAGEPANWNPLAAPATSDPALAAVVDAVLPAAFVPGPGQIEVRNDELLTSATSTAPAATPAAAPQTVVYEIDPRATWSDGVPITAADFVYTWEAQSGQARFRDSSGRPFTPASTSGYRQIASVTAANGDRDRVVVRFTTPDPDWPSLFDPILAAHVAAAVGFDHGFTDPVRSLVSGGPFLVQSYQPGADVVLVRNPRWWGPAANLSALDVTFVGSAAEATASLEEGQVDAAVTAFTPTSVAALAATDNLTVSVTDSGSFDDLVMNERSGPLAERAVRLALMLAVDRPSLARRAAATGDRAAAPILNRAFLPGQAGYRDDTDVLGRTTGPDVGRAERLLAAAGYVADGSTLTHLVRPVRLTLAVDTTSPLAGDEVAAVVAGGRSLGIAVTVTAPPAGTAPAAGTSMALVETALVASPSALAQTYGTGAAGNRSGYSSAFLDTLLARLGSVMSTAERNEIMDEVDAQVWSDAVDLPLLGVPQVLAFQSRYANLAPAPDVVGVGDDMASWGIPQST